MLTATDCCALQQAIAVRSLVDSTAELDLHDRQPTSPTLDALCQQLAVRLERAGAGEVALQSFATGAGQRYFDWTFPRPTQVEHAELSLSTEAAEPIPLCRQDTATGAVISAGRSTAEAGEVLEVVDVGSGTRAADFRGRRIAGRAVLVSGHCSATALHETLWARQAAALLLGPAAAEDPAELAALVPEGRQRPFVFRLDRSAFFRLRRALACQPRVTVRVRSTVTIGSGELLLLRASLPGSDLSRQRVLLWADLAGAPQAAAVAQGALTALARTVAAGTIAPPRRTVDLLLGAGSAALIAWLAEAAAGPQAPRAALLLDFARGTPSARELRLIDPPCWQPWFGVDLVEPHLLAQLDGRQPPSSERLALRRVPRPPRYLDPLAVRGIDVPTVVLQSDGELDGESLARVTAGVAISLAELAALDEADLPLLIDQAHLAAQGRLTRRAAELQRALSREANGSANARHLLWHCERSLTETLQRELRSLQSCGAYLGGGGPERVRLAEVAQDLQQTANSLGRTLCSTITARVGAPPRGLTSRRPRLTAIERRADAVVVQRRFAGPPPLRLVAREANRTDRAWLAEHRALLDQQPIDALLQLADGRATLRELIDRLRLDHPKTDLRLLWRYLELLQRAKLVRLHEPPTASTTVSTVTPLRDSP